MGIVNWLRRKLEPKRSQPDPSPLPKSPALESSVRNRFEGKDVPSATESGEHTDPPLVAISDQEVTPPSIAAAVEAQDDASPFIEASIAVPSSTPLPIATSPPTETWVPLETTAQVGSYCLPGLIYVGDSLAGVSANVSMEPCLIRPELKLDEAKPDRTGTWVGQWPSYSEIPSASRSAYLEWLAAGRNHPQTPIGYVYLFFYGLERRVLKDLRRTRRKILPELRTIMAEVERLQHIYGEQASFGDDASQFLEICRLLVPQEITALSPPWTFEPRDLPLSIEVALGSVASAQKPLPADWALAWAMHQSPTKLRTPAIRCFQELRYWFQLQYEQGFGAGIVLAPEDDQWLPTTATYQPASVTFGGAFDLSLPDIPKIKNPQASLAQILPLLDAGIQDLDLYSRWLGRNPDSQGSYGATLLLPAELMAAFATPEVNAFRQWVENSLASAEMTVVSGQELLQQWQAQPTEKLTKAEATLLSQYLAKLNIGVEPDVQMGGKPPNANRPVVLFRLADANIIEPSQKYTVATVLLHLSVLVAAADSEVTVPERQRLQDYLASTPHLQDRERLRLQARLQGLLADQLSLRGLKLKLQRFSSDRKLAIAQFLIHLAAVDGDINPEEIAILTKLYPLLGLDAQTVSSHIHQITLGTDLVFPTPSPPVVKVADVTDSEAALPEGLQLNRDLINAKVTESATVSALLADVFIEEDPSPQISASPDINGIAGLDIAHSQLLQQLGQQSSWARVDLEPMVATLDLLLDGALEIINEAAFDHCDEPLVEGDDPVTINLDVLQDLLEITPA